MAGCQGCVQSKIEQEQELSKIRKEAAEYASKNKTQVYVYKTPESTFSYVTAAAAAQLGIFNIVDVLHPL